MKDLFVVIARPGEGCEEWEGLTCKVLQIGSHDLFLAPLKPRPDNNNQDNFYWPMIDCDIVC